MYKIYTFTLYNLHYINAYYLLINVLYIYTILKDYIKYSNSLIIFYYFKYLYGF